MASWAIASHSVTLSVMLEVLLAVLFAQQPVRIDADSVFHDRDWFATLPQDVEQARLVAVERINKDLDARYVDKGTIEYHFRDLTEEGARERPAGTHAFRSTDRRGDLEVQVVEFYLEYLENRQMRLADEVLHEMTHAVMREQMDRESYIAIPEWVREGLAVHVAAQAERLARYVLARQRGEDPLAFLDGLEDKEERYDNYAEYGLAIGYLAGRREGALPAFYDDLVRRKRPWKEALEEASGQTWEEFQAGALAQAREALAPLAKQGYAEFREAARLYRTEGKADESERAFIAVVEAFPEGPWAPPARYFIGRAQMLQEHYDQARQMLRLYLDVDVGMAPYDDDARWYEAEIEQKEGFWREAAFRYARFIRDFPHVASRLPEAHARRVESLIKAGDRQGAEEALALLEKLYPDHAAAKRARQALER